MFKHNNLIRLISMLTLIVFVLCGCGNNQTSSSDNANEEELQYHNNIDYDNIVIDYIVYERMLDGNDPQFSYAKDLLAYGDYRHEIRIPKIDLCTKNIHDFNDKIYSSCEEYFEPVKTHKEEHIICIDYCYKQLNGIIAIEMQYKYGWIASDWIYSYAYYYYDVKNDCELTFDEYLKALNLTKQEIIEFAKKSEIYKNDPKYVAIDELLNALIDEESVIAVYPVAFTEFYVSDTATIICEGNIFDQTN